MAVDTLSPSPVTAGGGPADAARRLGAPAAPSQHEDAGEAAVVNGVRGVRGVRPAVIKRVSPIRITPILPPNRMSPASASSPSSGSRGSPLPASTEGRLAAPRMLSVGECEESIAESEVTQSLDRLTALAKETLARVDQIAMGSSATLRQSGSTPPTTKNVVIVSRAEQDSSGTSTSNGARPMGPVAPISILKRKTSREEGSVTPPVTFSSTVVDHNPRRHGILKKAGGSFDESHLCRSCSPETELSGSILKSSSKRRSSLEESTSRQSILKRKDSDDGHEPHGILKKRNSIDNSSEETHISISAHVLMAANNDVFPPNCEDVRPILKKRSSVEEHASPDSASVDIAPRPILKKKSSIETDDVDDWPKKTILKSSRRCSKEEDAETFEPFRRRSIGSVPSLWSGGSNVSLSDDKEPACGAEDALRHRLKVSRSYSSIRPASQLDLQGGLSTGALRRSSWDPNVQAAQKSEGAVHPISVAQRVSNMENALMPHKILQKNSRATSSPASSPTAAEDVIRSLSISNKSDSSLSVGPPGRLSSCEFTSESSLRSPLPASSLHRSELSPPPLSPPSLPRQANLQRPSPVPVHGRRTSLPQSSTKRDSSPGFSSIAGGECSFAFRNHVSSPLALKSFWGGNRAGSFLRTPPPDHLGDNWILKNKTSSPVLQNENWITSDSANSSCDNGMNSWDKVNDGNFKESQTLGLSTSSESIVNPSTELSLGSFAGSFDQTSHDTQSSSRPVEIDEPSQNFQCVKSYTEKTILGGAKMEDEDERRGLQRSSSRVSAKALMFSKMEEKVKQAAEEARSRKLIKADSNKGVSRYRNRKSDKSGEVSRFSTQPITVNELRGVKSSSDVSSSASATNLTKEDDDEDENDPSKLSLAERVKLFNQVLSTDQSNAQLQSIRRRAPTSRFKTQPVTIEEVSTAQNIIKQPPAQEMIGKASMAATKQIFENAAVNLSKSVSCSRVSGQQGGDIRTASPRRGILKSTPDATERKKKSFSQSASDEEEDSIDGSKLSTRSLEPNIVSSGSENTTSGLDHIKQVLCKENSDHLICNSKSTSVPKSVLQSKGLVENVDLVSSESDSESSSDSNDETNDYAAPANQTCRREHAENRQPASLVINPKRPTPSESDEKEVRRIISNDAVARRHQANLIKQQLTREREKQLKEKERPRPGRLDAGLTQRLGQQLQLRLPGQPPPLPLAKSRSQHVQLQQSDEDDEDEEMAVHSVQAGGLALRRCLTQPMPEQDKQGDQDVAANASIAERLKLLQQNGQTGWRKRVVKDAVKDVVKGLGEDRSISESQQVLKQLVLGTSCNVSAELPSELTSLQRSGSGDRSILADRLGKLENASQDWRKRVGQKDAEQFSVKGKMRVSSPASESPKPLSTPPIIPIISDVSSEVSPGVERKKKVPKPVRFQSKSGAVAHAFKRSLSAPGAEEDGDAPPSEQEPSDITEPAKARAPVPGPRVEVPQIDDTFDTFFSKAEKLTASCHDVEISDIDLDVAVARSSELLVQKRTVKVSGRRLASRNPVKALSARKDLCNEYVELRTGVAEREMKRLRAEKLAKNSSLAVEALAGLASKEDFSSVSLRKSASTSAMPNGATLLPYKELMLLQIKGRRHIQTRLVEPTAQSINSGDNFVLITPSQVFNFVGRYSNVIERARGAEIALHVQQNKDLGFNGVAPVITVSEERITCTGSQTAMFWRLLGSPDGPKAQGAGHPDEDEIYETAVLETNMVYELQGLELIPFEKYWGCIPRIEMLDPSKILVFDFGGELYIWNGKNAPLEMRKIAVQLAKELWEQGYNYSDCDICPLHSAAFLNQKSDLDEATCPKSAKKRPSWALIAKVTQHMETILFREKFLDWPDFTRVIRARNDSTKDKVVDASVDVRPCDAKEMFEFKPEDPDLMLEGSHLGRGNEYYDEETRRFYEIQTTGVKVWHVQEYEYSELPESSFGHFHSMDNYVVRWAYRVTVTTRALNGQPSKHAASQGRDRFCYFCWQGRNALVNDKGAAALLTVELDKERGPQVCIAQGLEPPAFLGLFEGEMITHSGRREDRKSSHGKFRMFAVRGGDEREANLVEVTPSMRQLRSRGSFILFNQHQKLLHIWHGSRCVPHIRKVATIVAQKLQRKLPAEFSISSHDQVDIQTEEEGSESEEFLKGVGGNNRHLYVSLIKDVKESHDQHSPRLFHLTSLSGVFTATEVAAPCRNSKATLPYPFQQSHLYGASQPAVFLLDNGKSLWLWQGWWPSERDELDSNVVAGGDGLGSGAVRWQAERRAAMKTALDYWNIQNPNMPPKAYLVWAGLEPLEFTNLFLEWTDRDDIAELSMQDGHKAGELLSVEAELARLTQSTYPAAQLLQRPLPDGVDPTKLELYLAPQHFEEILGMSKEEFFDLPQWKQSKLKKDAGLF